MTSEPQLRHIPEDTLEQYFMGRLSQAEAEPVEDHLLFCNLCQDGLAETEEFLRTVRVAAQELENNPLSAPWWKMWWEGLGIVPKPVFAAAACALALFVVFPRATQSPVTVELQTMRGPESAAPAPANAPLTLKLPLAGVESTGNLEIEVADTAGKIIERAKAEQSEGKAVAKVKGLSAGAYWARLYADGEMVLESGINVR